MKIDRVHSGKDNNADDCDFSDHYDKFPIVLLIGVAIVNKGVLLGNFGCIEFLLVSFEDYDDETWEKDNPNNKRSKSKAKSPHAMITMPTLNIIVQS